MSDHWTCPGCVRKQEHEQHNLDKHGEDVLPGQHTFLMPRLAYEAKLAADRARREAQQDPPPPD